MMRYALAIISLVGLAAGCITPGARESDGSDPISPIPMEVLTLVGCTGGGARFTVPSQSFEAPVPPGWESENGAPATITLFVTFCERVSLGEFERGPVQLVVESHEKFEAPSNCLAGEFTFINVLSRMIWSDPDIAMAVQQNLGIPTSVGTISTELIGSSQAGIARLQWSIQGDTSFMDLGLVENDVSETDPVYRYAWNRGTNLGILDFHWRQQQSWLETTAVYGQFAPPMLLSQSGLPYQAGAGVIAEHMFPSGEFEAYEGYECEKKSSLF